MCIQIPCALRSHVHTDPMCIQIPCAFRSKVHSDPMCSQPHVPDSCLAVQEFKEGRELAPSAEERVGIYRQLVNHMKEHFGDDARGKTKAFYFLPW